MEKFLIGLKGAMQNFRASNLIFNYSYQKFYDRQPRHQKRSRCGNRIIGFMLGEASIKILSLHHLT